MALVNVMYGVGDFLSALLGGESTLNTTCLKRFYGLDNNGFPLYQQTVIKIAGSRIVSHNICKGLSIALRPYSILKLLHVLLQT